MRKTHLTTIMGVLVTLLIGQTILSTSAIAPDEPPLYLHRVICKGYVYRHTGTPLSNVVVKVTTSSHETYRTKTNVNGYYYLAIYTNEYTNWKVSVDHPGYESQYYYIYSSGIQSRKFYIAPTDVKKIAFYFYNDKAVMSNIIKEFGSQLKKDEGFTVYYKKDIQDINAEFTKIDNLEDQDTILYLQFNGHGMRGNSKILLGYKDDGGDYWVDASYLNTQLKKLESKNIMVYIGACFSGGFIDACSKSGRFVITASDADHPTTARGKVPYSYPTFDYYFYYWLGKDKSDVEAFNRARADTLFYNQNNCPIGQNPLMNDQCAYTWFYWW
ncbi:MAG: carboxypeptidase regulatory-like domain-containing protein [Candidatus Heimdallarchaeaceae archaeon]